MERDTLDNFIPSFLRKYFSEEIVEKIATKDIITNHFDRAFVHKSFVGQEGHANDYEIYEKIGDAQLKMSFLHWLKSLFGDKVTEPKYFDRLESYFTGKQYLKNLTDILGFTPYILSTHTSNEDIFDDIKEDVFEAFVGALVFAFDEGLGVRGIGLVYCMEWIHKVYNEHARDSIRLENLDYFKQNRSKLNEIFNFFGWGNPKYSLTSIENKYFASVMGPSEVGTPRDIADRIIGTGKGGSKVESEEQAAGVAINTLAIHIVEIRNISEYFDTLKVLSGEKYVAGMKSKWAEVKKKASREGYDDLMMKVGSKGRSTYKAEIRGRKEGRFRTLNTFIGNTLMKSVKGVIGKFMNVE